MSKIAGILLILFGAATAFLGIKEVHQPSNLLTPYGAWSSIVLGSLMVLAGVAHFRAPHKSFLVSVPILLAFQLHVYCIALFYDVKNLPMFLGAHVLASLLILVFSYLGYRSSAMRGATP
ncbi:hypothetical protein L0222_17250 [bacterium]|nr:hypothetical protein [bacterium]MCI0604438.1 hypothetical protein [bacterium]